MSGPIILTGADRSGTTLMFGLIGSHPDVTMVRRMRLWRWFDGRFGDLADPANLERLIADLQRYRRLDQLQVDWASIEERASALPRPTYGGVFSMLFEGLAHLNGTSRWGDKTLHDEHRADRIFDDWPDAKIIHMVRDPRDRYASVSRRYGGRGKGMASITGRWLASISAGERNERKHRGRYLLVRFEDVARRPDLMAAKVCRFLDIPNDPAMMELGAMANETDTSGNSTFETIGAGTISARPVGRFSEILAPHETASIEFFCRRTMRRHGYEPVGVELSLGERLHWLGRSVPREAARLLAWRVQDRLRLRRGERIPGEELR